MPKYFTLDEANAIIDKIRPLVEEIIQLYQQIMAEQPEAWSAIERSAGNGGNPILSRMVKGFDRLDDLLHQIQATGAVVKDLSLGLVDFPALRKGREVYLCWKSGEARIEFWHEIESGFAGRQPMSNF